MEEINQETLNDELKYWKVISVKEDNKTLIIRLRIERPNYNDIHLYKSAVVIQWRWPNADKSPKPPEDVNQRQIEFEEAIDELTGDNDLSYLIQVGTGLGLKEWVFYTKDRDAFMVKFNDFLKGHDQYPIQIEFYDDPDWKIWLQFLDIYKRGIEQGVETKSILANSKKTKKSGT